MTRRGEGRMVLITGGCGFVGTNVAERLVRLGHRVEVFDNLSRAGAEKNLGWLQRSFGSRIGVTIGDVRDRHALKRAVSGVDHVFHFAAQVAVTTSVADPIDDFEVNAGGTLHLLEAIRHAPRRPSLLFTSTNKVYGDLQELAVEQRGERYVPSDLTTEQLGVSEQSPLDFHSPYGCSKGTADQYVIDYARSFGLRTAVFRMSCIYGPHQFGNEDQGWVAHFLVRALERAPITIYGDGRQVRDVLYVDDLSEAMVAAWENIDALAGGAFNVGGGPARSVSLLELIDMMSQELGERIAVDFADWRVGDQKYYVSDCSKLTSAIGWEPRTEVRDGIAKLLEWLRPELTRPPHASRRPLRVTGDAEARP